MFQVQVRLQDPLRCFLVRNPSNIFRDYQQLFGSAHHRDMFGLTSDHNFARSGPDNQKRKLVGIK